MNKKIIVGSVLAAVLLVLAGMSSVVGINDSEKKVVNSPLFNARMNNFLERENKPVTFNYLGKGKALNIFLEKRTTLQNLISRAMKVINTNPDILDKALNKIISSPDFVNILKQNNINVDDLKHQVNALKNNPELLKDTVDESVLNLPIDSDEPMPVGLSTSNPLGCIILIIAMVPVFMVLTILIATMTIITCTNLNGCFEDLWNNLVEGFIQGFSQ